MSSVDEAYVAASRQLEGISVPTNRFHAAWRSLCDSGEAPSIEYAGDLCLALASLDGHSQAIAILKNRLQGQLTQLARFHLTAEERTSLIDETLTDLCAGPRPRLSRYSAKGPLDAWLGVLLTRQALKYRAAPPTADLDEMVLGTSTEGVPEVEVLKQRFRGVFTEAFKSAIASLDIKQRNLLRQHYLDGLTLEELALLYRVHRATVARNLSDARTAVLQRTRDEVSQRAAINRLEVDSIVRLVQSHLDVSAAFFLNRSGVSK